MLTIQASKSAAGAKAYFRDGLSTADYYTEKNATIGQWHGTGAALLGLSGPVERDIFYALVDNQNPTTGENLTSRTKAGRRIGYDHTFGVPKSVSIMLYVMGDERIKDAIFSANNEAMAAIERDARARVRMKGRNYDRDTGNLIWASFFHDTTRPVDGVPDPHAHIHNYVFNATYDKIEKKWKAVQFGFLKENAPYYQSIFSAELSFRLRELGYSISRRGQFFEIAGIPRSLIERFSRRTNEIEQTAKERGITDTAEKAALGAKLRKTKQSFAKTDPAMEWRNRLSESDTGELRAVRSGDIGAESENLNAQEAVQYAITHCFESNTIVDEREIQRIALERGYGSVTLEHVQAAIKQQQLLTLEKGGRSWVTHRDTLSSEMRLINYAKSMRGTCSPIRANHAVNQLKAPDYQAAMKLLNSRDGLVALTGVAGAGKTSLLQAYTSALRDAGYQIHAFGVTATAARQSLRESGFSNATTIADFIRSDRRQRQAIGGVWIIDEAALMDTHTANQVLEAAHRLGARQVIWVGDRKQNQPVGRGDPFGLLIERKIMKEAHLPTHRRQQTENYRAAVDDLRAGRTGSAFSKFKAFGWIHEDGKDRYKELAKHFLDVIKSGRSVLAVTPTRAERDIVSKAVRDKLKEANVVNGKAEHKISALRPIYMTAAERSNPDSYQMGHVIEASQNIPGGELDGYTQSMIKRGTRGFFIKATNNGIFIKTPDNKLKFFKANHVDRFNVFEQYLLPIAPGDDLRFIRNGFTVEGNRLNNGATHKVSMIKRDGSIKLENGWTVPAEFGHLQHAYCSTGYSAQSRTVDVVMYAHDTKLSNRAALLNEAYTSLARARLAARIYTDNFEKLRSSLRPFQQSPNAADILDTSRQRGIQNAMYYKMLMQNRHINHMQKNQTTIYAQNLSGQQETQNNGRSRTYGRK